MGAWGKGEGRRAAGLRAAINPAFLGSKLILCGVDEWGEVGR